MIGAGNLKAMNELSGFTSLYNFDDLKPTSSFTLINTSPLALWNRKFGYARRSSSWRHSIEFVLAHIPLTKPGLDWMKNCRVIVSQVRKAFEQKYITVASLKTSSKRNSIGSFISHQESMFYQDRVWISWVIVFTS